MLTSHFSPKIAKAAAGWFTLSMDTAFSPQDAERLHQWRQAHPEHERAWQHIHQMRTSLHQLNSHAAYQTLSSLPSPARRSTLKTLAWLSMATGSGLLASKTETWQRQVADYSTDTGELKTLALADGTQIVLNTNSAIDVNLTHTARTVTLRYGEIMVTTGHLPGERRVFQLATNHGNIEPIGTQFNVRHLENSIAVAVLQGAVKIMPHHSQAVTLQAGMHTTFSSHHTEPATPASANAGAWRKGLLFANNMRLADLTQELARYRPGFIHCDSTVADFRISGVFPLSNTTQALDAIPNSLPVNIVYRTRYWVGMTAAQTGNMP
ncbi:FecR domain-containing protein [Methylophilus sp. 5]|uniref:FecR domain-containing protein n=1 Tax=Methylophilus sp. 5 TaxID=1112274 RepID=UPI000490D6CD|nr:FecR family protein [Methylophilus sp. 5]